MNKLFNLLGFILLIFSSCSQNDDNLLDNKQEFLVTKMSPKIFYPYISAINTTDNDYFSFEYDTQNRLIKQVGNIELTTFTNYNIDIFNKNTTIGITYTNNIASVEYFSQNNLVNIQKKRNYILNSNNNIIKKEIPQQAQTWFFNYSGNKIIEIRIKNTVETANIPDYIETFIYNSDHNLIKTELYEEIIEGNNINRHLIAIKSFDNYDSSYNPTQNLYLIEDFFYRSLSKNNFRKFKEETFSNGKLVSVNEMNWSFSYDNKGNILLY